MDNCTSSPFCHYFSLSNWTFVTNKSWLQSHGSKGHRRVKWLDLWKVTLLKKDSFVPASPLLLPLLACILPLGDDMQRGPGSPHSEQQKGEWRCGDCVPLHLCPKMNLVSSDIFSCPHCASILWGHRQQGKRPLLLVSSSQLEMFGEDYEDISKLHQLLTWTGLV
jgi:hypothetical protein